MSDDEAAGSRPVVVTGVDGVARAVDVLSAGGLVAFPTETVYGLGADAEQPDAVARIFVAKGRPTGHPLIVHLVDAGLLDAWASTVPAEARLLADAFWPGPLTLLLWRSEKVPDAVTGGRPTVGLRVPDHPVALALLDAFGGGVAAPSANRFGRVSPTTAADVVAELGGAVDLVLDGGPCPVGVESTIVDLTGDDPVVLRPGGVSGERLAEVLGRDLRQAVGEAAGVTSARAPGMLASHYSPLARVELVEEADAVARLVALLDRPSARPGPAPMIGLLAAGSVPGVPEGVMVLEPAGPADEYARVLYARLRQADRLGLDVLLCVPPPARGIGVAVVDRLRRAATPS